MSRKNETQSTATAGTGVMSLPNHSTPPGQASPLPGGQSLSESSRATVSSPITPDQVAAANARLTQASVEATKPKRAYTRRKGVPGLDPSLPASAGVPTVPLVSASIIKKGLLITCGVVAEVRQWPAYEMDEKTAEENAKYIEEAAAYYFPQIPAQTAKWIPVALGLGTHFGLAAFTEWMTKREARIAKEKEETETREREAQGVRAF